MDARAEHEFTISLSASAVDYQTGVLSGVTVAKAGVRATGKFVLIDGAGKVTRDVLSAKKKLPVFTDDRTLETLLGAAQDAGGRVKARSDHDDSLTARAGFAANFKKDGDKVVCDLHLNDSYRDRETVLETAKKSPELIGCSIDFFPSYEIQDGKAFMRIESLTAVDIVDAGAITPAGLFMASSVDNETKDKTSTSIETQIPSNMAAKEKDAPAPVTPDDCMTAIKALQSNLSEMVAGFVKSALAAVPASPNAGASADLTAINEKLAAVTAANEKLAADQAAFLTEQRETMKKLSQERAALGIRTTSASLAAGSSPADDRAAAAAAATGASKTYLDLVKEEKAKGKLSAADCHREVMRANPAAYNEHLAATGVLRRPAA